MVVKLREIKSNSSNTRSTPDNMQLDGEDIDARGQRDENEEPLKKKRKPRAKKVNKLSKEEVRQNHVSSEKKRRELVRTIYDELVRMIPDLQPSENRSEMVIYLKTINHLNWLYRNNKRLCGQLEKKYKELGKDDYRIPENLIWELGPGGDNFDDEANQGEEDNGDNTNSSNTNINVNFGTDTNTDTDSNRNNNNNGSNYD
ncbi:hypothetical protein ZYGR_0AG02900 [Zygosaccharomyces rouxii]|uniref:BHLH domain-containing protein n=1 Tax=Zygosaccharomyces rouxii TaxID=4956 RepID=A0A1Q3A969_ZYGRO|nr:hypothetical protein ZYGR_0AG02900 [Zygosaccharomyces rouxii]